MKIGPREETLLLRLRCLGQELQRQDNRMTRSPMYVVRQLDREGNRVWVQPFFTNKAAEDYVLLDRHNLTEPDIYVASGYRSAEWELVRALCLALAESEGS